MTAPNQHSKLAGNSSARPRLARFRRLVEKFKRPHRHRASRRNASPQPITSPQPEITLAPEISLEIVESTPVDKIATLTASGFYAYVAMRGPGSDYNDLPFACAREDGERTPGSRHGDETHLIVRDVKNKLVPLTTVPTDERTLDLESSPDTEGSLSGETNCQDNIPAPVPEASEGCSFYSDSEGNLATSLISPATFAQIAVGCTKWDSKLPTLVLVPQDQPRLRPETPQQREPGKPEEIEILAKQRCEESRQPLTPYYVPPESPALMFTAPGLDPLRSVSAEFSLLYDRMAPNTAREARLHRYGVPPRPEEASSPDGETYTYSEVQHALASHRGPVLDNIYAADVRANLVDRWRAVAQWEADERAVLVDINFLHSQARELENRRGRVAREIVAARNSEEAAKRRRIIEHIATHLREVVHKADAQWRSLQQTINQHADLATEVARTAAEVARMCRSVGKEPAEELSGVYGPYGHPLGIF